MNYNTVRAKHKRLVIARFKRLKGCVDCGYNDHPSALEFDHVRGKKSRTVASLTYASWDRIKEEISKCEIVCANCHSIRTEERRGMLT